MGMFDTYGPSRLQAECGYCTMKHYEIGDDVPMKEGIFQGSSGLLIIKDHILVATITIAGLDDIDLKKAK